jgi:hypothetical protein
MFTPSFTPRGEHSLLLRRMENGDNFTPRGQNSPLGDNLAPGAKFSSGGKVNNGPLELRVVISNPAGVIHKVAVFKKEKKAIVQSGHPEIN